MIEGLGSEGRYDEKIIEPLNGPDRTPKIPSSDPDWGV
jgi:hypothetical protein